MHNVERMKQYTRALVLVTFAYHAVVGLLLGPSVGCKMCPEHAFTCGVDSCTRLAAEIRLLRGLSPSSLRCTVLYVCTVHLQRQVVPGIHCTARARADVCNMSDRHTQ